MTRTDRELATRLLAAVPPCRLVHVPSCSSTMDLAAAAGDDMPTVFWAEHQTAGRGRQQRPWHDGEGLDLLVTFRVRPVLPVPVALPAVVPLCVLETLAAEGPLAPGPLSLPLQLKWPNDVLLGGQKIAGVLIDATTARSGVHLIGIGVNVNSGDFPPELSGVATSLRLFTGREHDRRDLLGTLAERLLAALAALARGDCAPFEERYRHHLGLMGQQVRLRAGLETTGQLADLGFARGLQLTDGRTFPLGQIQELRAATMP